MSEKSLRAFIVRPFGTKKDRNQNEVNFDAEGPGGTADLVEKAGERGAKAIILKTKDLFGG
jgi:hypothetical protein